MSLPTVGGSKNTWGTQLLTFLRTGHDENGRLNETEVNRVRSSFFVIQDNEPNNPDTGMIWIRPSNETVNQWTGTEWFQLNIAGPPGEQGGTLNILGSKATFEDITDPGTNPGDGWIVVDEQLIYAWDGDDWLPIASGTSVFDGESDTDIAGGFTLDHPTNPEIKLATWLTTTTAGGPTEYAVAKMQAAGIGVGGEALVESVNGQTGVVVLGAADVEALPDTTRYTPHATSFLYSGEEAQHPTFIKPLNDSILTIADHALDTQAWPWLVDMRPSGGDGVMLLFSSDHDNTLPGIYAATADTPLGPYSVVGQIYNDVVSGSQTETPSAIWVPEEALYYVYYHNYGVGPGSQSTLLATSATLESGSFTRVGVIDPYWDTYMPGDGHDGYFRPFRIGSDWYGYSAFGGGGKSLTAFRRSHDGITWYWHPQYLGHQTLWINHLTGYTFDWQVDWEHSCVFAWHGRPWIIVGVRDRSDTIAFTLGATGMRLVTAPLADDLCSFAARPIDITPTLDQVWEGSGDVTYIGNAFAWDGHLYMPYRAGSDAVEGVEHEIGILEIV